jgi:hypothetical protein
MAVAAGILPCSNSIAGIAQRNFGWNAMGGTALSRRQGLPLRSVVRLSIACRKLFLDFYISITIE